MYSVQIILFINLNAVEDSEGYFYFTQQLRQIFLLELTHFR